MCLARDLIVGTGASFRCAAGVLALIAKRFALASATPCFSTIRSWIIRLGCYSLRCPLPQHTSWVWMVDHTIQIGPQKLLAVVGCVLTDVPFGKRSLTLGDLRLIALVPMTHSTHEHVAAELEKATARTGVPRLIVSDHGTDVKKGVEDFQKRHPITAHVHDIAHYGANVLENPGHWRKGRVSVTDYPLYKFGKCAACESPPLEGLSRRTCRTSPEVNQAAELGTAPI